MVRVLAALAVLGACRPHARAPRPQAVGELRQALSVPGWDSVLLGERVIVLDADFASLTAYDARSGTRVWHTAVPDEPGGRHRLSVRGTTVFLRRATELVRFDGTTGELLGRTESLSSQCRVDEHAGVCVASCQCGFRLVDCETGAGLGQFYASAYVHEFSEDGQMDCRRSWDLGFVGATAGGLAWVTPESGEFKVDLVALDRGGREVRRLKHAPYRWRPHLSGVSPDGRWLWIGESDGALWVVDAERGAVVWQRADGKQPQHFVVWAGDGIYRLLGPEATLHDPATGTVRWKTTLAADTVGVPRGTRVASYLVHAEEKPITFAILAPEDGRALASFTVPAGEYLEEDPLGGYYVVEKRMWAYTFDGKLRAERAKAWPPNLWADGGYLVLFGENQIVVLDRGTLAVKAQLSGELGSASHAFAGGIVVQRSDENADERTPPEILILVEE